MAVPISGNFGLRWYALSYLAGFLLAGFVLHRLAKAGVWRVPANRVYDAVVLLGISTVIVGRLGYVLLYQPSLLWTFTDSFPFWGLVMLNKGGMASHGGMVGIAFAAWRISKGFRDDNGTIQGACPPLHVLDGLVLVGPIGLFLGRIANFINGELLGKIVSQPGQPAPSWAVRFPQEHITDHRPELTEPQQTDLARLVLEHVLPNDPEPDRFELGYSRVLDILQTGSAQASAEISQRLEPLVSARHPSQLYQAFAEGILTLAVLWYIARKPRLPGVVFAWFLIIYGLGRIITEFWRLPDDHFDGKGLLNLARPLGLSRGQWLSAAMVAIGITLLYFVIRKGGEKMLGWKKTAQPR